MSAVLVGPTVRTARAQPAVDTAVAGQRVTSVTSVPFEYINNHIFFEAEVDGHRGTFALDTGSPIAVLNGAYLQPGAHGLDTVTAPKTNPGPSLVGGAVAAFTVRIGPLTIHVTPTSAAAVSNLFMMGITDHQLVSQVVETDLGRPCLGILGSQTLAQFETVIDYVHMRLTLGAR